MIEWKTRRGIKGLWQTRSSVHVASGWRTIDSGSARAPEFEFQKSQRIVAMKPFRFERFGCSAQRRNYAVRISAKKSPAKVPPKRMVIWKKNEKRLNRIEHAVFFF